MTWNEQHFAVVVTPLQPPFQGEVMFFEFDEGKTLAVSRTEGKNLVTLLSGKPKGRQVVLAADGEKIRIYVAQ
jgi:hypothetical protein